MENIFHERWIISVIPFFSALYIAYIDKGWFWVSFLMVLNTFAYYLIVEVIKMKNLVKKDSSEKNKFKELIEKNKFTFSGVTSAMHLILVIITLLILYNYLEDLTAYTLFFLLCASLSYNLLYTSIIHFDVVLAKFRGQI